MTWPSPVSLSSQSKVTAMLRFQLLAILALLVLAGCDQANGKPKEVQAPAIQFDTAPETPPSQPIVRSDSKRTDACLCEGNCNCVDCKCSKAKPKQEVALKKAPPAEDEKPFASSSDEVTEKNEGPEDDIYFEYHTAPNCPPCVRWKEQELRKFSNRGWSVGPRSRIRVVEHEAIDEPLPKFVFFKYGKLVKTLHGYQSAKKLGDTYNAIHEGRESRSFEDVDYIENGPQPYEPQVQTVSNCGGVSYSQPYSNGYANCGGSYSYSSKRSRRSRSYYSQPTMYYYSNGVCVGCN